MASKTQQGQTPLQVIGLIAVIGLATSALAFFRYASAGGIDPILVFLLVAYPFLIGMAIYFHLRDKKITVTLREEYYIKWLLQSFAKVCQSETDLQIVREELSSTILRLIKPALVMIYELNGENKRLEMVHQAGLKNLPENAARGYAFGEGIPGWVMQNRNPVILADISEQFLQVDPWARALNFRSYAAVPIIVREDATGIIAMYSLEPNYFHDSNLLVAQLAAQLYGLSLASLHKA